MCKNQNNSRRINNTQKINDDSNNSNSVIDFTIVDCFTCNDIICPIRSTAIDNFHELLSA